MGSAPGYSNLTRALERDGFSLAPSRLASETLDVLLGTLDAPQESNVRRRGGEREVLDRLPLARDIARSAPVRHLAEAILGRPCFVVRGLLFDKTPAANWLVPWHQDLTVAVLERRAAKGFGPWTVKAGVVHAHAPAAVLERMLSLRIHLDDCPLDNGPLRVIPGSHRSGQLSVADTERWKTRSPPVTCVAARGEVLAFHPLLLHASSPATRPGHRRVLHLEFAAEPLPDGLDWRWQV